ncbi:MAG TPA: TIGR03364 family FAD-dependent oxidoreductase [Flavitalea sp.]|nr:TIGR03364 family FAD-dependent oxidoreductase [Flavitalea sp.]
MRKSALVIGAGIVGLAVARSLAIKGYTVKVFDRSERAIGASIRNFGMIWPIGQPSGELYDRALRSRDMWKQIGREGAFWFSEKGSLHVAHEEDEWIVLQELFHLFSQERGIELLTTDQVTSRSEAVVKKNLKGALFSPHEIIVDPREAIAALPIYLREKFHIEFVWGKCVRSISENEIVIGSHEKYKADIVFVCSGIDMETLYPREYQSQNLTKCKLQMMRLAAQPQGWQIGPALCGGLSLIHYDSFKAAPSLPKLKERYMDELKEYVDCGIHVMVSQNGRGELTIGDSHEYGRSHDPFDKIFINELIIHYLKKVAEFKSWSLIESWNGLYTKQVNGEPHCFFSPDPGIYVLNALGGAGMTLSFGLADDIVASI